MERGAQLVNEKRLLIDGYVYVRSGRPRGNRTHWECNRLWKKECPARATTVTARSGPVTVIKGMRCFVKILFLYFVILWNLLLNFLGPNKSEHSHPPNREEADAEKRKLNLKRKAETHPERPLSAIISEELAGASAGTLCLLPERENLKQSMRRARKKNAQPRPTTLEDIPRKTRQKALSPRYPSRMWNHYDATIENPARTNNVFKGCHDRFCFLMSKNHPDIYSCISPFMKEQAL